jgi:4-hydroxy-tetrahydrodipicolinate reductase
VLDQFEVLIDFTRPEATLDYLAICLSANKAMVIGTTGFDDAGLAIINNTAQKMPVFATTSPIFSAVPDGASTL